MGTETVTLIFLKNTVLHIFWNFIEKHQRYIIVLYWYFPVSFPKHFGTVISHQLIACNFMENWTSSHIFPCNFPKNFQDSYFSEWLWMTASNFISNTWVMNRINRSFFWKGIHIILVCVKKIAWTIRKNVCAPLDIHVLN